ncbi:ribokinase [Babesia caballi]|uniref:Ribokinase n=1 Tax=Babesia caballi TaxID=5871 RepID=A0AAV4LV25_BABCB|nr:ribokinase [Babesia caballi]
MVPPALPALESPMLPRISLPSLGMMRLGGSMETGSSATISGACVIEVEPWTGVDAQRPQGGARDDAGGEQLTLLGGGTARGHEARETVDEGGLARIGRPNEKHLAARAVSSVEQHAEKEVDAAPSAGAHEEDVPRLEPQRRCARLDEAVDVHDEALAAVRRQQVDLVERHVEAGLGAALLAARDHGDVARGVDGEGVAEDGDRFASGCGGALAEGDGAVAVYQATAHAGAPLATGFAVEGSNALQSRGFDEALLRWVPALEGDAAADALIRVDADLELLHKALPLTRGGFNALRPGLRQQLL